MLAAAVMVATPALASAHGHHTTLTELHHRAEGARLELSMLVAREDLERALATKPTPENVRRYMLARLELRRDQARIELRWVGMKEERRGFWIHLEARGVPELRDLVLVNRVLLASEPFVFHTVRVHPHDGAEAWTVTTSREKDRVALGRPPRQPAESR